MEGFGCLQGGEEVIQFVGSCFVLGKSSTKDHVRCLSIVFGELLEGFQTCFRA